MDEERTFYCEQAERNCPFDDRFRYCSCCELRLGVDDPKEKMVELLKLTPACICDLCGEEGRTDRVAGIIADSLIANGVTVKEVRDTDVGRWISVTEKLPDVIPCSAGTGYSEAVNVLTEGRKVLTAIWDGTEFITDADFWDAEGEQITHWTPVPLPLPKQSTEE